MTTIVTEPLPHAVGWTDISDAELKRVVMLFMRNFRSLDKRTAALERAFNEQKRKEA